VVKNYAVNGRSTKSFIKEGRWDSVMKYLQKDDYVFIQFGHNDEKIEDSTRYAAPNGLYRENLARFIKDARSKGANPILVTPVMRRKFDDKGKFTDTHGEYPGAVRTVAKELNVPLIDLHTSSQALIEQHGVEGSKKLFLWMDAKHFKAAPDGKKDDTHFSEYGASQMASLVCAEIKQKNLPFAKYLKPSAHPEKLAYELPKIYQPNFKKDTFQHRKIWCERWWYGIEYCRHQSNHYRMLKKRWRNRSDPGGLMVNGPDRSAKQCTIACCKRRIDLIHTQTVRNIH
jgi:DNA sulfur modification protein DndE